MSVVSNSSSLLSYLPQLFKESDTLFIAGTTGLSIQYDMGV